MLPTLPLGLTPSPFLSFKKSFCLHTSPFSLDLVLLLPILGPNYVTQNQQREAHSPKYYLLITPISYIYNTHNQINLITPNKTNYQSMGRQRGNSIVVGGGGGDGGASSSSSSIALLQERFRQLQKMREKREEMELLKLFPGPETTGQTNHYDPPARLLVHPEMPLTTTRPCFQDSLSLGLNLYTKQAEPRKPAKTPPFVDFWSVDSTSVSTMRAHDKPEVDTSLHL